jgi:hypothetical protein
LERPVRRVETRVEEGRLVEPRNAASRPEQLLQIMASRTAAFIATALATTSLITTILSAAILSSATVADRREGTQPHAVRLIARPVHGVGKQRPRRRRHHLGDRALALLLCWQRRLLEQRVEDGT